MDQEKIEQALDACYDAILAPETWPDALHRLARSVNAVGCRFRGRTGQQAILDLPMSRNIREFVSEFGRQEWWRIDHRAQRAWPRLMSGTPVLIEHDIATDEERRRLPLYNELSRRHDVPWWITVRVAVDARPLTFSLFRSASQGPFDREEAQRLAQLAHDFARMIRLSDGFALQHAKAELDTLDRLACAAVLIDWRGMVVRVNAQADALVGADLRVCRGALIASDPQSNRELRRLVASARAANGCRTERPAAHVLVRRIGRSPLAIEALPVSGLAADAFSRSHAVLVITDPELRPRLPEDTLRAMFGLTLAEARLASRIGGGESLSEAANQLGIGKETARSQLKAIFGKTGVRRQSELVALLSRLVRSATTFR